MHRRRALSALFLVGLLAGVVRAEERFVPPTFSVQLSGGASVRDTHLDAEPLLGHVRPSRIVGVSPFYARLDVQGWFLRFLGAEADGSLDVFTLRGDGNVFAARRFAGRGAVALRYVSDGGFTLSGSLGYGAWSTPVIVYAPDADTAALGSHGPVARVGVGLTKDRFDGSLNAMLSVPFGGVMRVWSVEPRLWLGARVVDLGATASLWLGGDFSALMERAGASYGGFTFRFALAARLTLQPPRPAGRPVDGGPDAAPEALVVRVTLPDGSAAKGAVVSLDGAAAVPVDDAGELRVSPGAGAHAVRVSLAGFRTASASAQVREGEAGEVLVLLVALTGPGRLSGVVRSAGGAKPLADAVVNVAEQSVRTGADGAYAFEQVGPGPVQVRVDAQGFSPSEEVAQVPPEAAATLDFSLEPLGKGSPATVRGLVRSRSGVAIKASVVVRGLKQKVAVTPEGRFVISVPAGDYTFVISAPGHVSQSKKVTLADGEQAIFHCELLKVSR